MRMHVRCVLSVLVLCLGAAPLTAQEQVRITGTVISALDGSPLSGARVFVKGTSIGTLTGTNGRYAIDARSPQDTLVFLLIGYQRVEVAIAERPVVNVSLEAAAIAMQEVVVTGYGTQQRRDVTGAVASVNAEDLTDIPTSANVEQTLEGRVPGVQVTPSSGAPGADAVIRIRGIGTLNDASPLFVVDGMLLDDISFLGAKDVASVEVLKDASATAIYGSRGANGVIIITTKRGVLDRPTRFTLRAYAGSQSVLDEIDLVDGPTYAKLTNELATNVGVEPDDLPFPNPDTVTTNTDWQDLLFESAPVQSYALSASGGTEKVAYYFSADLFRQSGVVPKSDFDRVTLRVSNDYHLTDHLLLGHNLAFSYTQGQRPPGILGQVYQADPAIAPGDGASGFNDAGFHGASAGNPAATLFYTRNDEEGSRLVGNIFGELTLFGSFTLRSSFGLDQSRTEFKSFRPVFFVSPAQRSDITELNASTTRRNSWLWENTLTYNYVSDLHRITALGGITAQQTFGEELGCGRTALPSESQNLWFCSAGDAASQTNFHRPLSDWKMFSYLFRTNYAYRDRYLFTASLRVDGSSRFGPDNRYGTFPSFAVGWVVSDEPFLRDNGLISALKLRGSWGKIGNDKIGNYPSVTTVTGNLNTVLGENETLQFGATIRDLANPEVRWEETSQTNFGADMTLFEGKLQATLDYYRRTTDGILVQVPIPAYVGVNSNPFVNAAKVLNTGFEASFNWRDRWGPLSYELGFNGSTINNEVKELAQGKEDIFGGGVGEIGNVTKTVVGQPIGCFWGFKVLGVFQTQEEIDNSAKRGPEVPGDLRFADLFSRDTTDGSPTFGQLIPVPDGVITDDDKTFIGCPIPDLVFGFHTRLTYGRFDFSAALSGQMGNKVFNGKKNFRFGYENFETSFQDRWQGEGTGKNNEPRLTTRGHNFLSSERFIEDGSFLKLQSAQIGYRLPASLTRSFRLGEARVYVSGTNLFLSTDYTGFTPEIVTESVIDTGIDRLAGVFPPSRTFTVGMDVTF
jgi:TonB-linked SusC/RagA family outer membrane protein